jgi:hypothetical protein
MPMWQESDLARVSEFLTCLETETKPSWDGSEATVKTVREMNPDIDPDTQVELGELGIHYGNALTDLDTQKEKVNELQARVLDAMGKARTGLVYDEPAFIRSSRKGGTPYLTKKRGS